MNEKFWLALAFFAFIALIVKLAKKHIMNAIDGKSQQVASEIEAAKAARIKAESALKEATQYLEDSKKYADKLLQDANIEAKKIIQDTESQIEQEVSKKTKAAISRIKMEEEKAIRDFKTDIIHGSINHFADIISNEVDGKEAQKFDDKASNDIEQALDKQLNS